MRKIRWPWAGVLGGGVFWYTAHNLGIYFSAFNCRHVWVTPVIHAGTFVGAVLCGLLSYQAWPDDNFDTAQRRQRVFSAGIGMAAASLFALVILWQGIATLVFRGCAR